MPRVAISIEELALGGGSKVTLDAAEQLAQRGHDVLVVTEREGPWWPELARRGLRGSVVRRAKLEPAAGHARRLAAFLAAERSDVFLFVAGWDNRAAHLASHLLDDRTAVVPIVQGDWPVLYRLVGQHEGAWNVVVGCGPKVHERLRQRFPDAPSLCITNGVEVPTTTEVASRVDWNLPLRLLFVGRLDDAHKGIFRLPEIVAGCGRRGIDVHLTVVGAGPDGGALQRKCANEGVADRVTLGGALPPGQVAAAMRSHHVLVFPTNTEGMPLVVLEAQANGCVVVTSTLPGITDVAIDDGTSGLLAGPPDSGLAERCAAAVASFSDAERWRRSSRAGIDRVRRLFSLDVMGDAYAALVDDLVTGRHRIARSGRLRSRWLDHVPPVALPATFVRRVRAARHRFSRWRGREADGP